MSDDNEEVEHEALLASLYLDNAATTDERALVETSTDALSAVDQLADVRAVLGATAPIAPLSERESHLAAALDVWERMSDGERAGEVTPSGGVSVAAAAAVSTPAMGSRRSRPKRRRQLAGVSGRQWFLAAAATLTVVAGAGFVVRELTADSEADTSEISADATPDDPVTELGELEAAEAAEVNGDNVGADVAPAETDLSDEAAEPGLFPDDAEAAEESSADAASTDDTLPGSEQPAPPPEEATIQIDNPDDLGLYASLAIPSLEAGPSANDDIDFEPAFGSCEAELGVEEELEPVVYAGIPVVVGIDLDNNVVLAYTAEDCDVVERTSLPADAGRGTEPGS